jgi:transcriptional regulator with XRE-family HTH domain
MASQSIALLHPEAVTHEEKRFFKELGGRIAELRKSQNLTQQQLADELDVAQQVVASYEIGRRRVPVSTLPALARVLGVTIEGLIGEAEKPARRGPSPKLQRHLERISTLPKPKQRAVIDVIEAMIAQSSR